MGTSYVSTPLLNEAHFDLKSQQVPSKTVSVALVTYERTHRAAPNDNSIKSRFPKSETQFYSESRSGKAGKRIFFPCSQSQGICQIATQNSCVHTHTVTFLALANCRCRHRQKSRTDFQVANGSWGAMPRSCKSSSGEEKSIIPALTPNRSGNFQLYCTCETRNPEWETSVGDKCGRQV